MPSRGYLTENKAINKLREEGFVAIRSSRSLGPYDIIAISDIVILLIQCKRTKLLKNRRPPRFIEELRAALAPKSPLVKKQLWTWVDRHGWFITDVP